MNEEYLGPDDYDIDLGDANKYYTNGVTKLAPGRKIMRSEAYIIEDGNVSGREEYTSKTYDLFRPNSRKPNSRQGILEKCDEIYKSFGILRQLIDMQVDFTIYGLRICHKTKTTERLLRKWYENVRGNEISERLINSLYTKSVAVIDRISGNLSSSRIKDMQAVAASNVPLGYTFLNPAIVECEEGKFAAMIKDKQYFIKFGPNEIQTIKNHPEIVKRFKAIKEDRAILKPENLIITHFKKDDWQVWADPNLLPVFDDVDMIKRLELADKVVVDGAISKVRIFKLGNLQFDYIPVDGAYDRMNELLKANGNGNTIDIIWGPDVEIIETKTDGFSFLGKEKFMPYIEKIYMSMGVPILSGSSRSTAQTGTLSLNALIQRLEYGRAQLIKFWQNEFDILKKSIGFKGEPIIEFNYPNLGDENAYKALLIQLADRNLISDEALDYAFKLDPNMEKIRIRREEDERDKLKRVRKATPYNEGDFEKVVLKNLAIKGLIDLNDLGLNVNLKEDDKMTGVPSQGRPTNSKDSVVRKRRTFKVSSELWASSAIDKITNIIKPMVLKSYKKRTLPQLSAEETRLYEELRISILMNLEPNSVVDSDSIDKALSKGRSRLFTEYLQACSDIAHEMNTQLTLEQKNYIAGIIYNENI